MQPTQLDVPTPTHHNLPEGWKAEKLGNLTVKVGSGITPKGGSKVYLESGVPLVRSQNVLTGKLSLEDVAYISVDQHQKMRFTWLQPLDVLLNITGASIGRSCTVPREFIEGNVNQHVCIIRTNKQKLHPYYLDYFLQSSQGQSQIDSFQAGGNRQGLNYDQVRSFEVSLPPLAEQQRIATILTKWDDAIGKLQTLINRKKQVKQGLMQQLLTGQRRFAEFNGQVWKTISLGDFVIKSSEKFNCDKAKKHLPCIELEHIDQGTGQLLGHTSTEFQKSIKNVFYAGDVIFGKLRPYLKKYFKASFDGVSSSETWVLRGKPNWCSNNYLFYLIQSSQFIDACEKTTGSKMPRADWSIVCDEFFSLPPLEEQRRIAAVLSAADLEIEGLTQELRLLQQQKRGLMQGLLTGNISVKQLNLIQNEQ